MIMVQPTTKICRFYNKPLLLLNWIWEWDQGPSLSMTSSIYSLSQWMVEKSSFCQILRILPFYSSSASFEILILFYLDDPKINWKLIERFILVSIDTVSFNTKDQFNYWRYIWGFRGTLRKREKESWGLKECMTKFIERKFD